MKKEMFILSENDAGRRLDRVIRKFLADMPISKLYEALRKGLIRINGKRMPLNYRTASGDVLTIAAILLPETRLLTTQAAPDIPAHALLYRSASTTHTSNIQASPSSAPALKADTAANISHTAAAPDEIPRLLAATDILIINKPAGIPVHGIYSIAEQLSAVLSDTAVNNSLSFKPGPLHRLDKDTTGVLCFSRTLAGAQWFSECLREKTIGKYYLGIVRGKMSAQLITIADNGVTMQTQCFHAGYNAQTDVSLMVFRLITGKKHQIRKHTLCAGHPLAGDTRYRGGRPLPHCTHYLLHAWKLFFPASRPTDMPVSIEAPLFQEMATSLTYLFPTWRKQAEQIVESVQSSYTDLTDLSTPPDY